MKDFGDFMKQAQRMKAELERIQEAAASKQVQGSSGGGMVTVTADGRGEVVAVRIEPEVVQSGDLEMLQDLILAATNEALRRSRELLTTEMGRLTGGLNLPGIL
jgi:DNA-binding YbaB/EbfC family protein